MIVNRFMWEDIEKGIHRQSKRVRCAIKFEDILNVKSKKLIKKIKIKIQNFQRLNVIKIQVEIMK